MATTPEGKVKAKVKKVIDSFYAYQFWPVQMGMGASTLDCLGSVCGNAFAVETKADATKKLTARQEFIKGEMEEAGIKVFVVYDDATLDELREWMQAIVLITGNGR